MFVTKAFERTVVKFSRPLAVDSGCHSAGCWKALSIQCHFPRRYQYIVIGPALVVLNDLAWEARSAPSGFGIGKSTSRCEGVEQFMTYVVWCYQKTLNSCSYAVKGTLCGRETNERCWCLKNESRCQVVNRRISHL